MFVTKSTGAPFANQPRDANFNSNVLLLHGDGTTGSNNSVFLDSSGYNTITKIGNPAQGTFSPYAPTGWSVLFNGTTDYLTVTPVSEVNSPAYGGLSFGSGSASNTNGDFTIEAWIYQTSDNGADKMIFMHWASPNPDAYAFYIRTNNRLVWQIYTSNSADVADLAISLNTWTHVAISRSGTTVRTFINGVLKETQTGVTNSANGNADPPTIGARPDGTNVFPGYISNLRITKRKALYTVNFTPSTVPLPQYQYPSIGGDVWKQIPGTGGVALLACSSSRFKDVHNADLVTNSYPGTNGIGVRGTPKITNFVPFAPTSAYAKARNGGSVYFNGSTDYLTTSASNSFYFSTEFFAIEFWIHPTSNTGNQVIFDTYANTYSAVGNTGGPGGMLMYISPFTSSGQNMAEVYFQYSNTSSNTVSGGPSVTAMNVYNAGDPALRINSLNTQYIKYNSWNYVKLAFAATGQVNNLNQVTGFPTGNSAVGLTIGYRRSTNGNTSLTYYSGYLSDFKITKYNAAYNTTSYFDYNRNNSNTSSIGYLPLYPFTSNSNYIAAYPPNTQFLISSTNAGIIDSTQKNNLIPVGSAQLSSTVSKFGGTSMFFNGTTDYLSSPTNDFFRMGTGNFTIEFWAYWNAVSGTIPGNVLHTVTSGTTGLSIYIISNRIALSRYNVADDLAAVSTETTGSWNHYAITRNNSIAYIFKNGVLLGSGSVTTNYVQSGLQIGLGAGSAVSGYIDELRVTKDLARYTASFTPPARQHPNR